MIRRWVHGWGQVLQFFGVITLLVGLLSIWFKDPLPLESSAGALSFVIGTMMKFFTEE